MVHLTYIQLLVGAPALLLVIVLAIRAILADRRAKAAPFRNYFGREYDRDLLRQSDWSESADWRDGDESRFTTFRLRGLDTSRRTPRANGTSDWDRDAD